MPLSADIVIDVVEQGESRPSASTSSPKVSLLMFPILKFGFNYVYVHYVKKLEAG